MDQIKPILRALVTHRFWVACGVMAPLLLGGWFATTSKMSKETADGKSRIESSYSKGNAIKQKVPHPNDTSHAGMQKFVNNVTREVLDAWELQ